MCILRALLALTLVLATIQTASPQQHRAGSPSPAAEFLQLSQSGVGGEALRTKKFLPGGKASPPQSLEVSIEGAPFMGSEKAAVTLVEFSDYQCFFCRRHDRQVAPQIVKEFVETGKVKYVFRDFPLASHPDASKAAEAAHCAGDQGKYWDMNDLLFNHKQAFTPQQLGAFGKSLGLDRDVFQGCLESGEHAKKVQYGLSEGRRLGVRGTPSFFLGFTDSDQRRIKVRKSLTGAHPYSTFRQAIEDLLEQ